ncbi:unnamed protein product [Acanthoscelides obtectus]|uniref:RRM domain-containing protein n=1 Tax=Acanthoscelides obtectus TaxID=200917 RepID=A0A9P0K1X5_ACAOB|nr:unnamed protein product [Acanthoscelides obtectus]CAK1669879.1 Peroxisome proliferator-activated receptor gamma coactivator-related protein 1 [Acanthoscelides obtectus]
MDIDLFRDEEQFSTYQNNYLDLDVSTSPNNYSNSDNVYQWNYSTTSDICEELESTSHISTGNINSPPKEDLQKIMNEWQQLLNMDPLCDDFSIEDALTNTTEQTEDETSSQEQSSLDEILDDPNTSHFDITEYINQDATKPKTAQPSHRIRAGCKKIDLKAQRYIIEDDEPEVDVETVSDSEDGEASIKKECTDKVCDDKVKAESVYIEKKHIVVKEEALEEANNLDVMEKDRVVKDSFVQENGKTVKSENVKKEVFPEIKKDVCKVKQEPRIVNRLVEEKKYDAKSSVKTIEVKACSKMSKSQSTCPSEQTSESTTSMVKMGMQQTSKLPQQKNAPLLPQDLLDRMKESAKRKPISVIPPIPAKRRHGNRSKAQDQKPTPQAQPQAPACSDYIYLDHNYCSTSTSSASSVQGSPASYREMPKKDSGFESAEDELKDTIDVHERQPMVKGADGKLMVSLLKVNTIRTTEPRQKKKLNLEEYKKRREGFFMSQNSSRNCSPASSTCSSPLPEDDNMKLIRHQEKLMRMAQEVLNTPPKSERKSEPTVVVPTRKPLPVPADIEKKELVSIGVNTDFKVRKNLDPLAPVEQLEEIKPLLKKASAKINCNSLITSLIENIPKVIDSCDAPTISEPPAKKDHGEDKTIVYLPKNRSSVKTVSTLVQTNISLIKQTKASMRRQNREYRKRRRSSSGSASERSRSSSSTSSGCSRSRERGRTKGRKRDRRRSSHTSCGSTRSSRSSRSSVSGYPLSYSSRCSSRSRSRSISPKHSRKEKERLKEVEERRVIYVGRLLPTSTRDELRKRFQKFGPITNVSLHKREHGDNYGFVTFANKLDAYEAIEHGNDDPYLPKYDLSFGGRRIFCKTSYSDLDNVHDDAPYFPSRTVEDSFDTLLREVQEKLRKRKA